MYYILYIMFISGLAADIEEERGIFPNIEECWAVADSIARSPDVFSVRCTLVQNK